MRHKPLFAMSVLLAIALLAVSSGGSKPWQPQGARRVERMVLDPVYSRFQWQVSYGEYADGKYQIIAVRTFQIDLEKGTMDDGEYEAPLAPETHQTIGALILKMEELCRVYTEAWDGTPPVESAPVALH